MRYRLLLLATTALVAASAPARAEPISFAIGLTAAIQGLGATAAWAAGIGGSIVGVGVSLGLSTLSSLLSPKPKAGDANTGVETTVQVGGDVARQIAVGRVAAKGQLVHVNCWGPSNDYLDQIFVLSDWHSRGLVSVWINGKRELPILTAEGPSWKYYTFEAYPDQLYFTFWDGTQTIADPAYVLSSNPVGRWTNNSILTGMTYAAARFRYVKDAPLFDNGIPDLKIEFDGARLYDPRFDDTSGGAGPQRWDDPATWDFTDNPVVATYNYLRGFHRAGERILGMGVPAYDLIGETWIAAANACEEPVTLDAGGTEQRYRCAIILTADEGTPHRQTLDALLSTFAGYLYDYGGSYYCQAGVAQSSVRTITDGDLVMGQPVTYAAKRSRAELVNVVHGQYLDAPSGYQPQSYKAQVSDADIATDGEELGRSLDLMAVTSQFQGERIAKIRRREARAQATASVTIGFQHIDLQVGDWITWASTRRGTKTWRIVDREVSAETRAVTLNLAETNAAVFSWAALDEGAAPAVPIRLLPGTRIETVSNFYVAAPTIISDDGSTELPALEFGWHPVTDPAVDDVVIEYRLVGDTVSSRVIDPTPDDGAYIVSPVVNATLYEARATIRCTPNRPTIWTPWVQVTTSADFYASLRDLQVTVDKLAAQLRHDLEAISRHGQAVIDEYADLGKLPVRDAILALDAKIERLAATNATQEATKYEAIERTKLAASGKANEAFVAIERETNLRISEDEAITDVVEVQASRLGSAEAAIVLNQQTQASVNSAQASLNTTVSARLGSAETGLAGQATALTSVTSRVTIAEGSITSQASALTSLQSTVTNQGSTIVGQANAATLLTTRVTATEGSIVSLSQSVTSLSASIGALNGTVGGQANAISVLSASVSSINGQVSSIASQTTALQSTVGSNTATLTSYGASINGLSVRFGVAGYVSGALGGFVFSGVAQNNGGAVFSMLFDVQQFVITNGATNKTPFAIVGDKVVIPDLRVTNSIVVPGSLLQTGASVGIGAANLTPLGFTGTEGPFTIPGSEIVVNTPGPAIIDVIVQVNMDVSTVSAGAGTVYGGIHVGVGSQWELVRREVSFGTANTVRADTIRRFRVGGGTHTIRLGYSYSRPGDGAVGRLDLLGGKYDWSAILDGTAV